ncbi:MAG: ferredoxin-like protein [Sedimentibacter sp.]
MSKNEIKKNILDKETTRREFLKLSGKGIGGTFISLSLLNLLGCTNPNVEEVSVFPLAQGVLIADKARCTGCQRCETNCTLANDGKVQPFISRIKVSRNLYFGTDGPKIAYRRADGQFGNLLMSPETCRQCAEPYCAKACPVGAIEVNEIGARVVNTEKCIGCGTCTEACPWHLPTVDPETSKSTKCLECGVCAANCPTGALRIVPWEEVKYAMRKLGYKA